MLTAPIREDMSMRRRWELDESEWTLRGWRQNDWELGATFARVEQGRPDVAPIPVRVPGSVRGALTAAGIVPSPYRGTDSRASEWIENRHWSWTTTLPAAALDALGDEESLHIVAQSLDHAGAVLIGDEIVVTFANAMIPVELDISDAVRRGGRELTIVFTDVPGDIGQIGRTSRIRDWKSRFNYGWDWTPRVVQIGIAGPVTLERRSGALLRDTVVTAVPTGEVRAGDTHASAVIEVSWARGDAGGGSVTASAAAPDGTLLGQAATGAQDGRLRLVLPAAPLWRPQTSAPALVEVTVDLDAPAVDRPAHDRVVRRVGVRDVRWLPVEGAVEGAEPWLLQLNGEKIFLAGVNWVPIRPDYADVDVEDYRRRLDEYRRLGIVVLRVWGGSAREQDVFYDLADEMGFLLWQELPLSSSGLDNRPPDDAEFAAQVGAIAHAYAVGLAHHPSIILWGGGNELTTGPEGDRPDRPLDDTHPAVAAGRAAFAAVDPHRRYVSTSPTGPSIWGDPEAVGQGVHHDVHGPWESDETERGWRAYWDADDALLRSEVGMSGASPVELLEEFGLFGSCSAPEERAALRQLWSHTSAWWLGEFDRWDGSGGLADWVDRSQQRQADWLAYAARVTRDRFPRVGGFIVWLGHDTFPCAVSLSLLDFHGRPKPAAEALGRVFRGE